MSPETALYTELVLLLLAIGCAGGFLSGLLGVGGGIIFVPALYFCFTSVGLDAAHIMHVAVGTSLAVVFATGSASAYHHYQRKSVDMAIVRSWGPAIVLGVALGSLFASAVDGHVLKTIFASLMILTAVYMALSKDKPEAEHGRKLPPAAQYVSCFIIGLLSSMIGIGGAIMNIPMMAYSGVPIQRAIGTGTALSIAVSLPGMIGYMISGFPHMADLPPLSLGYVNLIALATIIPMSIFLAPVGVRVSHGLPKPVLRRIFAVVLALVSLRMFMTL
ncbi:MAG: sulfite exporter TauE/SafE family protein [Alphaproteobacteria bacterium]|nr:sulfite exporter TauE/SafE family protein [Alphaproteobacteria bacterium]